MPSTREARIVVAALVLFAACSPSTHGTGGVTADTHTWFPVNSGAVHAVGRPLPITGGTIGCDSCHPPNTDTFGAGDGGTGGVNCVSCHEHDQTTTDMLHLAVPLYAYGATTCLTCHAKSDHYAFDHSGVTTCAACHDVGTPFAALPVAGFTHIPITSDCGGCHGTKSWTDASSAPSNSFDPTKTITLTAQIPSYAGTSIVLLTPLVEKLNMVMNHGTTQVPSATLASCQNCHAQASSGGYYPGELHASLDVLGLPQPTGCSDCHTPSTPTGFVGPLATAPARTPPSPEMKHDAVSWVDGGPTTVGLAKQDCRACHVAPTIDVPTTWASGFDGGGVTYHVSLTKAGLAQPTSCVDCHANSRPNALLTSADSGIAAGLVFDHRNAVALGDCASCHAKGGATQWTSWSKGQYHTTGSTNPATCLPCHEGERPTSTTGWKSTTYTNSPFDYVGTSGDGGMPHGDGEDCAVCHAGPGTGGTWGSTSQSWQGGTYTHGPTASSSRTCLPCHRTQRADLLGIAPASIDNFDHSVSGTGDCYGCHQATVKAGHYTKLLPLPTDWQDGQRYPGDTLVAAPGQFVNVTEVALARASGLVTGMTSSTVTLNNAMLHTSSALPTELDAGTAASPNYNQCWHCHTHAAGSTTVNDYTNGVLHQAFTNYSANPDGTGAKVLPQPTTCLDCHNQMRPANIVEKAASSLIPMDHAASFTGSVNLGGTSVTSVANVDCIACHAQPGVAWSDGQFHPKIGSGQPADCVACHYPLMADGTKSDLTSTTKYAMKHQSTTYALQACSTCHTAALGKSTTGTTSPLWNPGALHASLASQPSGCNDCHSVSIPSAMTQSSLTYSMPQGGTASNGAQWMSHGAANVVGKDCVTCHQSEASASTTASTAWSRSVAFHTLVATGVTTCNACHGQGTAGTGNNMPSGLTNSTTVTTSSAATGTVYDQLTHTDLNVTSHECNFCHTQVGPSSTAGVQGKEWAQAKFHASFTVSSPLVMNGTTGRCSNCHMNVKPGSTYTAQDHSTFTATSTQDCSGCHAWPGSSATTPDWKNATGAHASSGSTAASTLDCGTCHGQNGSSTTHLAVAASAHYGGVTNGNKCITCHINFTAFAGTTANLLYPHSNSSANSGGCQGCHVFVSQVYTTLTTTPALTHPTTTGAHTFSQTFNVTGSNDNQSFTANHTATKLSACGACHQYASTTASTNIWTFKHAPKNPGISNSKSSNGCNECH